MPKPNPKQPCPADDAQSFVAVYVCMWICMSACYVPFIRCRCTTKGTQALPASRTAFIQRSSSPFPPITRGLLAPSGVAPRTS